MITYNQFIYENNLNVNEYIEEIYEKFTLPEKFYEVSDKIFKDLKSNFKFIGTFGTIITLFFPIVESFMKNGNFKVDINPTTITLATIGAVSILIDNDSEKLAKVLRILKDERWADIIKKLAEAIKNIKELFITLAKATGKMINTLTGMFGYTMLLVPFMKLLTTYTSNQSLTFDDFKGIGMSLLGGVVVTSVQKLIEYLIKEIPKLNSKIKFHPQALPVAH